MTHFVYMNTQKWLVWKESDFCSERKSWNDFYFSVEPPFQESVLVNKTFTHVQEQNKSNAPRHSAYIPSSVKSPLKKKIRDENLLTYNIEWSSKNLWKMIYLLM